ncbi:MAG: transporter [bacterium]
MRFATLVLLYVVLNATAQILLKMGMSSQILSVRGGDAFSLIFKVILNPKLIVGILLFGLSFLTWLIIVSKEELSYAFPIVVGLGYAAIVILSFIILKENIGFLKLIGIGLIGIGIIFIFRG